MTTKFDITEKCQERTELCDLHNTVDYWRGYLKALNDVKVIPSTMAFDKGAIGLQKALHKARTLLALQSGAVEGAALLPRIPE